MDKPLTSSQARLFSDTLHHLMVHLSTAKEPEDEAGGSSPGDNPMVRMLNGPAKNEIMQLMQLVTPQLIQKLMPMMQGGSSMDPSLLQLNKAIISRAGEEVIYRIPPGRLVSRWTASKQGYKIDEFSFDVNWWWVCLNLRTVWRIYRQRRAGKSES